MTARIVLSFFIAGFVLSCGKLIDQNWELLTPVPCAENQRVSANECVACEAGETNAAGDNSLGPDTTCDTTLCGENEYVSANACVACAAGTVRPAGDQASGDDTTCNEVTCTENQYVKNNACLDCAPGTSRPAGDLAKGDDTLCTATLCAEDEHVVSNACVACTGNTNIAGDDASGADTPCDGGLCPENFYVDDGACVACAPGSSNPAGDNSAEGDTSCTVIECGANEKVQQNTCQSCAPGTTSAAGALATGADTSCTATLCGADEYVSSNACVACANGSSNAADDDASGADTQCDVTMCGGPGDLDQRVVDNGGVFECGACPMGQENITADPATAGPSTCADPFVPHTVCGSGPNAGNHVASSTEAQVNVDDGSFTIVECGCAEEPGLGGQAGSVCTLPSGRVVKFLVTASADGGHNVESPDGMSVDTTTPKSSGFFTMDSVLAPGTYSYICTEHDSMSGSLIIQ